MSNNKKTKIMVISDETDTHAVYVEPLESHGYEVILETSGRKAVNRIAHEVPDLIILGIMISDFDGMHVLECIKNNPKTENISVIILSAIDDESMIKKALDLGACNYLIRNQVPICDYLKCVSKAIS